MADCRPLLQFLDAFSEAAPSYHSHPALTANHGDGADPPRDVFTDNYERVSTRGHHRHTSTQTDYSRTSSSASRRTDSNTYKTHSTQGTSYGSYHTTPASQHHDKPHLGASSEDYPDRDGIRPATAVMNAATRSWQADEEEDAVDTPKQNKPSPSDGNLHHVGTTERTPSRSPSCSLGRDAVRRLLLPDSISVETKPENIPLPESPTAPSSTKIADWLRMQYEAGYRAPAPQSQGKALPPTPRRTGLVGAVEGNSPTVIPNTPPPRANVPALSTSPPKTPSQLFRHDLLTEIIAQDFTSTSSPTSATGHDITAPVGGPLTEARKSRELLWSPTEYVGPVKAKRSRSFGASSVFSGLAGGGARRDSSLTTDDAASTSDRTVRPMASTTSAHRRSGLEPLNLLTAKVSRRRSVGDVLDASWSNRASVADSLRTWKMPNGGTSARTTLYGMGAGNGGANQADPQIDDGSQFAGVACPAGPNQPSSTDAPSAPPIATVDIPSPVSDMHQLPPLPRCSAPSTHSKAASLNNVLLSFGKTIKRRASVQPGGFHLGAAGSRSFPQQQHIQAEPASTSTARYPPPVAGGPAAGSERTGKSSKVPKRSMSINSLFSIKQAHPQQYAPSESQGSTQTVDVGGTSFKIIHDSSRNRRQSHDAYHYRRRSSSSQSNARELPDSPHDHVRQPGSPAIRKSSIPSPTGFTKTTSPLSSSEVGGMYLTLSPSPSLSSRMGDFFDAGPPNGSAKTLSAPSEAVPGGLVSGPHNQTPPCRFEVADLSDVRRMSREEEAKLATLAEQQVARDAHLRANLVNKFKRTSPTPST